MTTLRHAAEANAALRATWLIGLLCAAALARAALNGNATLTAFAAGLGFGMLLLAGAALAGWRVGRPSARGLAIGIAGGIVLVLLPRLLHPGVGAPIGMRPEPFVAWMAVTGVVAVGEEALLRGALLDAVRDAAGLPAAVLLTSVAFALMHVPLYGWGVIPVDLAAGVWLAGLRLARGGVGAPAAAHLLADLAGWWL
jgi:membrane protease YdiL (CAAX protease family)